MSSFDQPLPPFNASDPSATFLSSSCLDFLLIEIVPMAYRLANELDTAGETGSVAGNGETSVAEVGETKGASPAPVSKKLDEEEERDAVFYRLEMLGYRVGLGLVERWVLNLRLVLYYAAFFAPVSLPYPHLSSPCLFNPQTFPLKLHAFLSFIDWRSHTVCLVSLSRCLASLGIYPASARNSAVYGLAANNMLQEIPYAIHIHA
jgi:hypothetical protein